MDVTNPQSMNVCNIVPSLKHMIVANVNASIRSGIKKMYVVGSYSSGEITVLLDDNSNKICMSDVDVVVDVSFPVFLKCHTINLAQKLSEMLTRELNLKGIKTHVSISITSFTLFNFLHYFSPRNSVYLYELTPICFSETTCSNTNQCAPTGMDCINLVFSSIADYVFAKLNLFEDVTIYEKTYLLAKRCLSVLYSFLLFNGVYPKSYATRISYARGCFYKFRGVLSEADLQILETLVDYKLNGDWGILAQNLPVKSKNIDDVFSFIDGYFQELVTKVFVYELTNYLNLAKPRQTTLTSTLVKLLEVYRKKTEVNFHNRFMVVLQYLFLFSKAKSSEKLKLALHSVLIEKLRIDDFLRLAVSALFVSILDESLNLNLETAAETKRLWSLFMD